jgi:hypothetical protein
MRFAFENKDFYKLMFVWEEPLRHVESCEASDWHEGDHAFDILVKTVSQCQEKGHFKKLDGQAMSFLIWSTMHGLCTLATSGHLAHVALAKQSGVDTDKLMSNTYETFVKMLEQLKS